MNQEKEIKKQSMHCANIILSLIRSADLSLLCLHRKWDLEMKL